MQEQNLFTYPSNPGYQRDSSTSKAAAESVVSTAATMRSRILRLLGNSADGFTIDQIAVFLKCQTGTSSARMRELELQGLIIKSDRTRLTRAKKSAKIYYLKAAQQ